MAIRFIAIIGTVLLLPGALQPQGSRREYLLSNVAVSGVTAGIGALLNRGPHETAPSAFAKGLLKGGVGGVMIFAGKDLARTMWSRDKLAYAWLARATNSVGVSIVESAAAGRGLFSQLHLNVAVTRVDVEPSSGRVMLRLLPAAAVGAIVDATKYRLDVDRSLKLGLFVFEAKNTFIGGAGATRVNSIAYTPKFNERHVSETLAHELVHVLQYEDLAALTYYLQRPSQRWIESHTSRVARWIYPDLEYGALWIRYHWVESDDYCKNRLEREAMKLGGIPVC